MEERKDARVQLQVPVTLMITKCSGERFEITGHSVDISSQGFGVIINQDIIPPGSIIAIASPSRFRSDATVQWVSRDSQTGYIRLGLSSV